MRSSWDYPFNQLWLPLLHWQWITFMNNVINIPFNLRSCRASPNYQKKWPKRIKKPFLIGGMHLAVQQLTVRNQRTKNNVGTLPLYAYMPDPTKPVLVIFQDFPSRCWVYLPVCKSGYVLAKQFDCVIDLYGTLGPIQSIFIPFPLLIVWADKSKLDFWIVPNNTLFYSQYFFLFLLLIIYHFSETGLFLSKHFHCKVLWSIPTPLKHLELLIKRSWSIQLEDRYSLFYMTHDLRSAVG